MARPQNLFSRLKEALSPDTVAPAPSAPSPADGANQGAALSREFPRVLVLLLDPEEKPVGVDGAIRKLKGTFPNSELTLAANVKNKAIADSLAPTDRFIPFNFPAKEVDREKEQQKLSALLTGHYDLAIDLRVQPDTRFLLQTAKSALKCGIGSRSSYPFLDIALPGPDELTTDAPVEMIAAGRFMSRIPQENPFGYQIDLSNANGHVVYGPYIRLAPEPYKITFWFSITRENQEAMENPITFEIVSDRTVAQTESIESEGHESLSSGRISLYFENRWAAKDIEFRIKIRNKPFAGMLRFYGVTAERLAFTRTTRLDRSDYLLLLTELVACRLEARRAGVQPDS
jgi:hypothetical protein